MYRNILYAVLGFAILAIIGYIVSAATVFLVWEVTGVRDRDGGASMAVAYVFAPICAAVSGLAGAVFAVRYAIRHLRRDSAAEAAGRDRRILLTLIGVVAGVFAGWQAANIAQALLRPFIFDSRIVFRAFELAHETLTPFGTLVGGWLAFQWDKRRRVDAE